MGQSKMSLLKQSQRERRLKFEDAMLLDLKMGGGAISQGIGVASRSLEKQGSKLFPRAFQRNTALATP